MPPIVRKALENIGLTDKQIKVLLVLLESGPMFAAAAAKRAMLNRTTTYGILKELCEIGLASSAKKENFVQYQSIEPGLLPGYIERRCDELTESKDQLAGALPQIKLLRTRGHTLPKVQFFEGKEGVEQAYEDTLENNKGKILHEITGIDAVYTKLDPKFVKYYLEKRTRLGIKSVYVTPGTELARDRSKDDEKYMRLAKFIPPRFTFDTEIAIYDNKVGIFSYALENPVAIIIEDDTIAHTMKTLFDYIEQTTS